MFRKKTGFTLIEIVIAMLVVFIAVIGLLAAYASSFELVETARNTTYALNEAQEKVEELRGHNFFDIFDDYANTNFTVDGIAAGNSNGLVEVGNTNPGLLLVTVTVCWRQRSGRIIGGDSGLNPLSSSPVRLVTYIANR
ncbi:MAG: prepilin-type N-terminal cleavage/methylation domain-containing protein [Candidatus Omnitrophota bacterium]